MPHLDAGDDRLAIVRSQALQCRLVSFERFAANCLFNRRGTEVRAVALDCVRRPALCPTQLIADTIEKRLTKVRLECAVVARLEGTETLHHVRERVLYQVVGVERSAGPCRQPRFSS